MVLCVRVDDAVSACLGAGSEGADHCCWLGYMKNGSQVDQEKIKGLILSEAQQCLTGRIGGNEPYYAWSYMKQVTYDNCVAESSAIAEKLMEMRKHLFDRLKAERARS